MISKRNDFITSVASKILVWGSLLGVLYLLRSFSLLLFLVFIFSYIQSNAVNRLEGVIKKRTLRVVIVGLSFLTVFVVIVSAIVPQIRYQARNFISNSSHYAHSVDNEIVRLTDRYPVLEQLMPKAVADATVPLPHEEWKLRNSALVRVLGAFFGVGDQGSEKQSVINVFNTARDAGSRLLAVISSFILSLLFSFLIVLDLPNLQKGARSLRETRLRFVYDEVADNLVVFGRTVGRAFEAQFVVASINTVLTGVGIWAIHIRDEIAFLCLIVFICGFVPIAGVFISSIPICLLALAQGGISKVILVIVLITAVHAVESYILNPRIFGTHMKLNPVMVMILMTISGKLFGVWGLLLCLPIATFVFQHAIQYKDRRPSLSDESTPVLQVTPSTEETP